ncbi:DNA-binding CsgD family transcriptional regulator [Saccharothrix ecbatanensis]|uniref:DNA-binding CsgD family transcriptional regulator n=1 Tax=Saccharothrix ecbatanensis TaxID=1105145 RepID=A0A7W9HJG1_9PSEU|nr:helix-turn-helix transcriptional regulator [Saccharothrix ecbatanensis]MBB5803422.1 DNA-binding CsgD family transcriptional regulator [Saccharothrix ecbatanensis]
MGDGESGLLVGLVSAEAAAVFDQLSRGPGLPVGGDRGMFDLNDRACGELFDAGVLTFFGSGEQRLVRAVHPSIAVRRLLDRQHHRLVELQLQLAGAWERFAGMVSPTTGLLGDTIDDGQIEIIRDYPEMTRLAAGLYRSPKRLLRATLNGHFVSGSTTEGVLLPPRDAVDSGVEFRMIYDVKHVSDQWGSHSVGQSVRAGEQAKVRKTVPVKMMHVDDSVALVTIDAAGSLGALHVRSPSLLAVLAQWFDMLWDDPGSTVIGGQDLVSLTATQQKVLRLMASGFTDTAIAHQTNTAVRTVRRHVTAILDILGAESRFTAGVAAAKRGWL